MANIVKGQIGNALESVAPDGIVATADAIFDETKNKSQDQINEDVDQGLSAQYHNTGYYECGTEAATAAKTVTASGYQLPSTAPYGGSIKVKFTNKNSAASPTLSINQSTPKPLYYNGAIASSTNTWADGEVLDLYYDGTNFNATSVVDKFATGEKVKEVSIDSTPTSGSNNLVKSGGVHNELALGAVYDVSAKNPTAGPNNDGKWESLSALLSDANLNTLIPTSVRKGGMSIKFVQSSDNKYVQARCMAQNFTTDVRQWQGVDDVPTAGSDNLVKSGGVADAVEHIKVEIGFSETITLTTDDEVALGITGTSVTAPVSSSWCGLVIPLIKGATYDFGTPFDSSTQKGWQTIGILNKYPEIGDTISTFLNSTTARLFIPSDSQKYALIYIRVGSLPYDYSYKSNGIKKDIEDLSVELSDYENETDETLDSIQNEMGEPTVIKTITSADYVNMIWGGASGVVASTSAFNGYIVQFFKDRKYIINGTILSCQLFTHTPTIGDTDSQGNISSNVDYTPSQDYYGLITFRVEQTVSVKKYAWGLSEIIENTKNENEKNGEDIKRGCSNVSYANMAWAGSSTGIIASTSLLNGFVIHVPAGQTELYLDGVESILSAASFLHVPAIGNTDVLGGEKFIISGSQIKCTFASNANGLWVLFTVRIAEVDITGVTYSLSNFVYDAVKSGLKGKRILCLGDSITEFVQSDGNNYPKYLALLSGATVYGCGVGGARLSRRAEIDPTTIGGSYAALDIVSLTDAIATEDFTNAVAAAEYLKDHASDDNTAQINVLANDVDFDELDWIIVMGGTNDWTSDVPIGQDSDAGDYTTIKGALRKIVQNLCTRCPNARILLMAEPPRYYQQRDRAHFCDVWENGQGDTLTDVINAIIESAGFSHVPIVDLYRKLGWNEFNWDTYYKYLATGIVDLTHPYSGFRYIAEMAMKYIKNNYY